MSDTVTAEPAELDADTLLVAEKVVRDRITRTNWASEARSLKLAADDIHKLWEATA